MEVRHAVGIALLALVTALPQPARAACKAGILLELPVTMMGTRPMVEASFEGNEVQLIADSGAFHSIISDSVATQFKLRRMANANLEMEGIGGRVQASVAVARDFGLAGHTLHDVQFVVGGSEAGSGTAGVMGQNILGLMDTEYDFAKGVIRLIHAEDCRNTSLAYWASAQPYSMMDIEELSTTQRHTIGVAYVNGARIRVLFDTGASASVLSLKAAARAGVKRGDAGVVDSGMESGFGRRLESTWIAPFASFKIGDEEIKNTHLRIGEIGGLGIDMLIGADFFLSHRVLVANSQHRLYFTYNGGSVFNLTTTPATTTASRQADKPVADAAQSAAPADPSAPVDPATLARRGAAHASRREYEAALADLDQACKLNPTDAECFRQRALVYLQTGKREAGLADIDRALQLRPGDVQYLLLRAGLRLADGKRAEALADVQAADLSAPPGADVRFAIGSAYLELDRFSEAIAQNGQWLESHPDDHKRWEALNSRCWARALWGQELDTAERDCSAALKLLDKKSSEYGQVLDSRGLVRLRKGKPAEAIADYDAALALNPSQAWSLYGRGLSKLRLAGSAEGNADIAAAVALEADLSERAKRYGIAP